MGHAEVMGFFGKTLDQPGAHVSDGLRNFL